MSVSAVGSSAAPQVAVRASDGDSAAKEAAESAATKAAEKAGGGVAPTATTATTGVNKLA
jgi:hypothetical protein